MPLLGTLCSHWQSRIDGLWRVGACSLGPVESSLPTDTNECRQAFPRHLPDMHRTDRLHPSHRVKCRATRASSTPPPEALIVFACPPP